MRMLLYILIALNGLVAAQLLGWIPSLLEDSREPERLKRQIAPTIAKPVSLDPGGQANSTLPPLPPPSTFCFDVGPLTAAEAENLRLNLSKSEPEFKLEATEYADGASYMVVTPPATSAREAQRREQALRNFGIRETYVIPEGELRNAVSIGVFKTKDAADGLVASLGTRGVANLQIVSRPNPTKAGLRVDGVTQPKLDRARELLRQMPVQACPARVPAVAAPPPAAPS